MQQPLRHQCLEEMLDTVPRAALEQPGKRQSSGRHIAGSRAAQELVQPGFAQGRPQGIQRLQHGVNIGGVEAGRHRNRGQTFPALQGHHGRRGLAVVAAERRRRGLLPVPKIVQHRPAPAVSRLAVVYDLIQAAQALRALLCQVGGDPLTCFRRKIETCQGQHHAVAGLGDTLDQVSPLQLPECQPRLHITPAKGHAPAFRQTSRAFFVSMHPDLPECRLHSVDSQRFVVDKPFAGTPVSKVI